MPNYECAVVLAPTLSDEQVQEQIETIKTWFTGLGAQVSDVDVWGRKRLAYPIGKNQEGFYVIYYFTLDREQPRLVEFEKRVNTTESILRHLVIRLPLLKEPPRLPKEEEEAEGGEVERAAEPAEEAEAAPTAPVPEATAEPPAPSTEQPPAETPPVSTE